MTETHFERARRSVDLAPVIRKEFEQSGSPLALTYVLEQDRYLRKIDESVMAACIADATVAMDKAGNHDYALAFRTEHAQRFIQALDSFSEQAMGKTPYRDKTRAFSIAQFNICYQMARFNETGRHTYSVSDGLAMKMALTELRGLKCEDLRLPQSCLYLQIPEFLGFRIHNALSGWHRVEGMYLTEDSSDSAVNAGPERIGLDTDGGRSWRACLVGKANEAATHELDDALLYFTIPLPADWSADDALNDVVAKFRTHKDHDASFAEHQEEVVYEWKRVFQWVLNVMVYAVTPDSDHYFFRDNKEADSIWRRTQKLPKGSKKREELNAKLRGMNQQPRTLLGRNVIVTPQLRNMFEHRDQRKGRTLMVRTLVSGHWRRFAVGAGRKERDYRFVEPYWRGPDGLETPEATEHKLD